MDEINIDKMDEINIEELAAYKAAREACDEAHEAYDRARMTFRVGRSAHLARVALEAHNAYVRANVVLNETFTVCREAHVAAIVACVALIVVDKAHEADYMAAREAYEAAREAHEAARVPFDKAIMGFDKANEALNKADEDYREVADEALELAAAVYREVADEDCGVSHL
jgi:hypothetical protein